MYEGYFLTSFSCRRNRRGGALERENDVLDHLLPPRNVQSVRSRNAGHRLGLVERGVAGSDARTSLDAVEGGDDKHDEGENGTDPAAQSTLVSRLSLTNPETGFGSAEKREQDEPGRDKTALDDIAARPCHVAAIDRVGEGRKRGNTAKVKDLCGRT